MEVIRNALGEIISRSRNLAGIRRTVARQAVYGVAITQLPHGRGTLRIDFTNGDNFETRFESFEQLKWSLRNWRNLYSATLVVDFKGRGKIDYWNPALGEKPIRRTFLF